MFRATCLGCESSRIELILDLGMHPYADRFVSAERAHEPDKLYPLQVTLCPNCGLLQNRTETPPAERYADYSYVASHSPASRQHWMNYAESVASIVGLNDQSLVVEVGSNDGYLCAQFAKAARVVGVDASAEMVALSRAAGIDTHHGFFDYQRGVDLAGHYGRVDLVVANNVLNHADDLDGFLRAATWLLQPEGVLVFQVPYWQSMYDACSYDQVYHEHVTYWTKTAAHRVLARRGLEVFRVDEVDYHGKSLRVFARPGLPTERPVVTAEMAALDATSYAAARAELLRRRRALLQRLYAIRTPIVCAGAAAKGNTFLNWHRLDASVVSFVTDASPLKVGKLTPGGRIPIRTDETLAGLDRPHVIVTAWNLIEPIRANVQRVNPSAVFINPTEPQP